MRNQFTLGQRLVGDGYEPLVIAEIGINHGGSLSVAKSMVESAASSGCEVIKHQTHFVEDEMVASARNIFPPNDSRSIWDVIADCSLDPEEEIELKKYVEDRGLIYLSTPFSRRAADFLNDIGVVGFKIGSGECTNLALVDHIAKFGKPIIMSTGMETVDRIRPAVEIAKSRKAPIALLECTNLYPSPPEFVSLQGISELRNEFSDCVVGFSDHSIGPDISIAALALGASIIERHFTDSRYREGPDISCSMDAVELRYLLKAAKEVHLALQNPKKRESKEEAVYAFARSSIVADRQIPAGHEITAEDIWARRPGDGEIEGIHYFDLIGKVARRTINQGEKLSWLDVEVTDISSL